MAIAPRQTPAKYRGNINGGSVAFSSNVAAGSLITVVITWGLSTGPATISDTLGNTYHVAWDVNNTFGSIRTTCYYAYNSPAGANTITASGSNSTGDMQAAEFSGVLATADPLDAAGTTASGLGTAPAAGTITPSVDGCLLVAGFVAAGGTSIVDPPSGFTSLMTEATAPIAAADYEIQTTLTARNPAWSYTTSNRWAAGVACFKPGPPPATDPRRSPPPQLQGPRALRPTRTGDYTVPLPPIIEYSNQPLLRVDIYSAAGARLALGPMTSVLGFEQWADLDRIGGAKLTLPADDAKSLLVVPDVELRLFRGGEGFIGDYDVVETMVGQDAEGKAVLEVDLDSVEGRIARQNGGFGVVLAAASPSTAVSSALTGSVFSAGSVDSSGHTLDRRHDAEDGWTMLTDDMRTFSFHVRANTLGSGASPTRTIDAGEFGSDSGIILGLGGYPLADIRKRSTRAKVTRVIPMGVGEGSPMLSLKASTHGQNLYPTETADVTATFCSKTLTVPVTPHSGSFFYVFTETGGLGAYQIDRTRTISGATTGRTWKVNLWIRSAGANVGKVVDIALIASGGAGGTESTSQAVTLTTSWQRVALSLTLTANDKTTLDLRLNRSVSVTAGEVLYLDTDDGEFWESTIYPYPVKFGYNPDFTKYYFIRDYDSEVARGVIPDYRSWKGAYPTAATKAAWQASCDAMYDDAAEYLVLSKDAVSTYTAKPLGLRLVSAGTQIVRNGDKHRLRFNGVGRDGAWLTVNSLLWQMGWRRRFLEDGADEWDLTLASLDSHYQSALERLGAQLQQWRGSLAELKQSNYTMHAEVTGFLGSSAPGSPTTITIRPPMTGILAVWAATLTATQVAGAAKAVDMAVNNSVAGSVTLGTGTAAGSSQGLDVIDYYQQAPTPVPLPDTAFGVGDTSFTITLSAAGAGPYQYRLELLLECTKIPL